MLFGAFIMLDNILIFIVKGLRMSGDHLTTVEDDISRERAFADRGAKQALFAYFHAFECIPESLYS